MAEAVAYQDAADQIVIRGTKYAPISRIQDANLHRLNYIIIGCVLSAILVIVLLVITYRFRRKFIRCCQNRMRKSETAQAIIDMDGNDHTDETMIKKRSDPLQSAKSPGMRTQINIILVESNLYPPRKWFKSNEFRFIDEDPADDFTN